MDQDGEVRMVGGRAEKPQRITWEENESPTQVSYSWTEITAYGVYDPTLPSAVEKRKKRDAEEAAKLAKSQGGRSPSPPKEEL